MFYLSKFSQSIRICFVLNLFLGLILSSCIQEEEISLLSEPLEAPAATSNNNAQTNPSSEEVSWYEIGYLIGQIDAEFFVKETFEKKKCPKVNSLPSSSGPIIKPPSSVACSMTTALLKDLFYDSVGKYFELTNQNIDRGSWRSLGRRDGFNTKLCEMSINYAFNYGCNQAWFGKKYPEEASDSGTNTGGSNEGDTGSGGSTGPLEDDDDCSTCIDIPSGF